MAKFQITAPDGQTYEVNAPEGASEDDAIQYVQDNLYTPKEVKQPKSLTGNSYGFQNPFSKGATPLQNLKENSLTFGKGLIGGAADIGDTILNAGAALDKAVLGRSDVANQQRNAALEAFQRENAQDPLYATGRIGGNIAGTAGVGGAAGLGLKAASKTPQAAAWADAIASGGLSGASLVNKVGGGAIQGALGASLIDPSSAGTGAAIGSAIPLVGAVAPSIGSGIANLTGGLRTNTGGQPIKTAARAGLEGGRAQKTFTENMRGQVPLEDVVNVAERKLGQLGQEASNAYRSGMVNIKNDRSILDFSGIDNSLSKALNDVTFKGEVKDEAGAKVLQTINKEVERWKSLDPAEFHTPEGLDALKQKIGSIVESVDPLKEKNAKRIGNSIYNAVKGEINQQAPTYAKVMKDYSEGMDEINEIRKTLSVGGKSTNDTKLRKLQSIMRNNVNTNYGAREKLVNQLERGSGDISNAVAGQSLNDWLPKGLGKIASVPTAGVGFATGGLPAMLGLLASSSPRLAGETALKLGQGARYVRNAAGKLVPTIPAMAGLLNQ
jgi:hypothetical protein